MKVLLINPEPGFYNGSASSSAPLGLLSIATYLSQHEYTVKIYDRTIKHEPLKKVLDSFYPDIVGVSYISFKPVIDALEISKVCKKRCIPVVWGGQMASLLPEKTIESGFVDYVIMGEGEITWLDLLNTLQKGSSLKNVDGLAFKENGEIIINKCRELANLADLPIIDWSFVDIEKYFQPIFMCKKMMYICFSKGCFGNCSFCINEPFHHCTYRKRPLEYVFEEIEYLIKNYMMDGVYIAAELFCKNNSEMYDFCEMKKNKSLDFKWGCQTRIGIFGKDDFQYMYDNGCRWLFFGIESGSEKMLKGVNKSINLNLVPETFSSCAKAGIVTIASFMIGLIDETYEDIMKSIDLALNLDSAMYTFSCLAPCPGSEVLNYVTKNRNFTAPEKMIDYANVRYIDEPDPNFSKIPSKDLIIIRDYFQWLSFTTPPRTEVKSPTNVFAVKVIFDALKRSMSGGFTYFIANTFASLKKIISILGHVYLHPIIRKKYNLYRRK